MDLDIIRQEIDQIDNQIVKLLEERMHLVEGVVAYKKASGKPILDTKREAVIFEKVRSRVEDKRYQETIVATFSDILKKLFFFPTYSTQKATMLPCYKAKIIKIQNHHFNIHCSLNNLVLIRNTIFNFIKNSKIFALSIVTRWFLEYKVFLLEQI